MTMTLAPAAPSPCVAPETSPAVAPLMEPPHTSRVLRGPEDFGAWLKGLAPQSICGRQHSAGGCPLATYLSARYGPESQPCVTTYNYHLENRQYPMPRWAQLFVLHIDQTGALTHRRGQVRVEYALECLQEALGQEERLNREAATVDLGPWEAGAGPLAEGETT